MKQFIWSIGIASSHIQMIPPVPVCTVVFVSTENFFISLRFGFADFLISSGWTKLFASTKISISLALGYFKLHFRIS